MSEQRLTIYDPSEPARPYAVLARGEEGLRIVDVRPGVRDDTERWLREGFVAIEGEPPLVNLVDVLPSDPDFLVRLARKVERSQMLDTRLEYASHDVVCAEASQHGHAVARTAGAERRGNLPASRHGFLARTARTGSGASKNAPRPA